MQSVRPSRRASVEWWQPRKRQPGPTAVSGNRWRPKRGEGRLRPKPNLSAMPSWGRARAMRRGSGAGSERRTLSKDYAASSLSRIRSCRQGDGDRGATEAGDGGGEDATGNGGDEGHCLEPQCGWTPNSASRDNEPGRARRRFAFDGFCGGAIADGDRAGLRLEAKLEGGDSETASTGLPERAGEERSGAKAAGRPAARAPGVCWNPAHFRSLCVVSVWTVVATSPRRIPCGCSAVSSLHKLCCRADEVTRHRIHRAGQAARRARFGELRARSASVGPTRSVEHAGTPLRVATRVGTERPRRDSANPDSNAQSG